MLLKGNTMFKNQELMNVKNSQELKFLLKLFRDKILLILTLGMPIQRYQIILVIKLVFYTYLHLTVPFSHGYFLDSLFECLYYLEGSLLPKLFIYCIIIIAHAQIKHYLMVSADLRFLTFLLSIQVCQLYSEIESKGRTK